MPLERGADSADGPRGLQLGDGRPARSARAITVLQQVEVALERLLPAVARRDLLAEPHDLRLALLPLLDRPLLGVHDVLLEDGVLGVVAREVEPFLVEALS